MNPSFEVSEDETALLLSTDGETTWADFGELRTT